MLWSICTQYVSFPTKNSTRLFMHQKINHPFSKAQTLPQTTALAIGMDAKVPKTYGCQSKWSRTENWVCRWENAVERRKRTEQVGISAASLRLCPCRLQADLNTDLLLCYRLLVPPSCCQWHHPRDIVKKSTHFSCSCCPTVSLPSKNQLFTPVTVCKIWYLVQVVTVSVVQILK